MTATQRKKMKRGAWSPAARAKAAATRAANKLNGSSVESSNKAVLAYLSKAEAMIVKGGKRIGAVETLMLLALNTLRGEL